VKEDDLRRRELADFLRTRRARLAPEVCGLSSGSRRRTVGLRREEVAELAGVSPSWYTKLEQGRDIRISVRFLRSLAEALRLNSVEAAQLIELALPKPASRFSPATSELIPALQRMIDNMAISPAYILTARGDYLVSNNAAFHVFGMYGDNSNFEANLLINLFLNKKIRSMLSSWNDSANYQVSVFRSAYGRNSGDPSFVGLVERLIKDSPEFRRIWKKHEMLSQSTRTMVFNHHPLGQLKFEYFSFYADADTNLRVDIYTPLDELDSKRRVVELIQSSSPSK
jgi:transcriptional regulator with XRE-family HTH domain